MPDPVLATAPSIDRCSDRFLLDAYTGKGGFGDGSYLIPHPRELASKFERRQQLAVYPNFTRKIVDVYMGFLWKQSPTRETDDYYAEFSANADGAQTDLNRLLFTYQRLALLLGTVYVIVDKPAVDAQTRADEPMPYLTLRLPDQLVDEKKNSAGRWTLVTFVEDVDGQRQYRTYTREGWELRYEMDGILIDRGEYTLDSVPVVALHAAEPLDPNESRAHSWAYDLAGLCWDLYNARSEMRELFRSQTFAVLALPVSSDAERESLSDLTISTENALAFNGTTSGQPGYIAPPPDPVDLYMKLIEATVTDIYRVANLEFVGGVQQSGVALSFHFQEANSTLRGMAEQCEQTENEIAHLVYQWAGQTFNGHISYSNEFNMSDIREEISVALDSISLALGAEFDAAMKKRLAKKILANDTSATTMNAIDDEIDAQGDEYGDRLARELD